MGGRGKHALDGGELFRHEQRQLFQRRSLEHHQKVVAAGHEVDVAHFLKAVDLLGDGVKAVVALDVYKRQAVYNPTILHIPYQRAHCAAEYSV